MFKNRWRRSLPLFLNPDLLICSTKVHFLVHFTLFISLCNFPNTLLNGWVEHHYITLLKKELVKMKKKFSNCYSKGSCLNPIQDGPFRGPREMLNFDFKEKGLGRVSPPYFVYDFSRRWFLKLHFINWPNFITRLPLLLEI